MLKLLQNHNLFISTNYLYSTADVQQWLKSAEDTNEKWRINAENTKLVTNELNTLNAQLEENDQRNTGAIRFYQCWY
ncbi:hypothetical protein ACVXZY_11040 [Staphylococcus aureus]